jgi:pilus assembly protein CpaF
VVETEDNFTSADGKLVRAQGFPRHPDRFEEYGIDLPSLLAGRGNDGANDVR